MLKIKYHASFKKDYKQEQEHIVTYFRNVKKEKPWQTYM